MGNKFCIKDFTEKEDIVTQRNEINQNKCLSTSMNNENAQIIENKEKDYSGESKLNPGKNKEIQTLNEEYKVYGPLSFSERKKLANKLFKEGTEESCKKALDYDNTSFNIILKNYDFQNNQNLFYSFNESISKDNFEKLILEIITSDSWDKSEIEKKFEEYKEELNNRIKFNQPIDTDNKALFFYKCKMHILIYLLEPNNISDFEKRLETKGDIYKRMGISKVIKNNLYPKESSKLKLFTIILNYNDEPGVYMLNSILDENYDTEYYYNEILKLEHVDQNLISYSENYIRAEDMAFKKDKYSLNNLIYFLQTRDLEKILSNLIYFYKYDYFIKDYWLNEYLPKLKEILTIIIKSEYYSTIISELFKKRKNDINYIQSEEFINFLFSKINIIPMPIYDLPLIDKFSLDIFLGGYGSYNMYLEGARGFKGKIELILKLGNQVLYLIHLGAHFIYSYFSIISKNYYDLKCPYITINDKLIQNETGDQVELLLFNKVITNFELKECLFLLNTNNHTIYNHFDSFRGDFMKSKQKKYSALTENFKGPFSELINEINWERIEDDKYYPIYISSKIRGNGPFIIFHRRKNDAIGRYEEKNLS